MIESFANAVAEDLFYDRKSKSTRSFPNELRRNARRKLLYLHDAADLKDLKVPPGNRLETLKCNWKGFHWGRQFRKWFWKGRNLVYSAILTCVLHCGEGAIGKSL